jgi:hypothetical protein
MLNDLDFLTSPEWQTMPESIPSVLEKNLLKEAEVASPDAVYTIALKALWHNCPDAMEVALQRLEDSMIPEAQASDIQFMKQKLEFTRIRQTFVAQCIEYRSSGPATESSIATLRSGIEAIEERCKQLMTAQPDEQMTQLPGLISKRDTIMLLSRIRDISAKLLPKRGSAGTIQALEK